MLPLFAKKRNPRYKCYNKHCTALMLRFVKIFVCHLPIRTLSLNLLRDMYICHTYRQPWSSRMPSSTSTATAGGMSRQCLSDQKQKPAQARPSTHQNPSVAEPCPHCKRTFCLGLKYESETARIPVSRNLSTTQRLAASSSLAMKSTRRFRR